MIYLKKNIFFLSIILLTNCSNYFKNDFDDNSPTSGKLNVYYDEGLMLHIKNQTLTFQSQYPNANLMLYPSSETEAVNALYHDSCEAIVISRLLSIEEKKVFETKLFYPKYSAVAKSAVAIISNSNSTLKKISFEKVVDLLKGLNNVKDSLGNELKLVVLLDKKNSSLTLYLRDSILKEKNFSSSCNVLTSSIEAINYVAKNKNAIAFVDFAWLSDCDDSIFKANINKIKFIAVSKPNSQNFEYPSQSTFKLNTYPFTRTIYVIRKTGDFTLAKGFESFLAGPKGQLVFLKQGLLPCRQSERAIKIKMEKM